MNYYNPYFITTYPNMLSSTQTTSLFASLKGNLTLSNVLNGTQKTLNFINQLIPVARQLTPMMRNAKTMFKVMNEFKKVETPKNEAIESKKTIDTKPEKNKFEMKQTINRPTFFI